jgi:hypothetical protein
MSKDDDDAVTDTFLKRCGLALIAALTVIIMLSPFVMGFVEANTTRRGYVIMIVALVVFIVVYFADLATWKSRERKYR